MALRTCRECKKPVGHGSDACPHCGATSPWLRKNPRRGNDALWVMGSLIIGVILLALAGCHADIYAEVQSNTSWSGAFGDRTVDGTGNAKVDLPDEPPQCVVVQKETTQGTLRVRVVASGGVISPGGSGWVETTAAYGVVSACSGY